MLLWGLSLDTPNTAEVYIRAVDRNQATSEPVSGDIVIDESVPILTGY